MDILVCVKRVPLSGGRWILNAEGTDIDTSSSFLSYTLSPHEECAVEAAVQLVEANGGSVTVLALGVADSAEQIRDLLAVGADRGVVLETDGREWDPQATAGAITTHIQSASYDLILMGTEAADTADYQVGIRVAHALGMPVVTNVKGLTVTDGVARCERPAGAAREVYEVPLPAVITVKDGLNIPRYPSVPGRIKARKKPIDTVAVERPELLLEKVSLALPAVEARTAVVLGNGPDAVPAVIDVFRQIGVI